MLVNWRGVLIVLSVLTAVIVVGSLDLCCTSRRDPAVLARVKDELASGRQEGLVLRRDQLAAELLRLRTLNRRLVEQGEVKRSREVTRLIVELEGQYHRLNDRIGRSAGTKQKD